VGRVSDHGLDGMLTLEGRQWDGYREHNREERLAAFASHGWQSDQSLGTRLNLSVIRNREELPDSLSREQVDADPGQASAAASSGDFAKDVDAWRVASTTSWVPDETRRLDLGLAFERQNLFHPILAADQLFPGFPGLVSEREHHDA
jgi:iron complex outermembrane receptor protein